MAKEPTPEIGVGAVLDWLRSLDKADRKAIGLDLMRVWEVSKMVFGKCARRFRASE